MSTDNVGPRKELMMLVGEVVIRFGGEWDGRVAKPKRGLLDTFYVADAILADPELLDAICEYRARQINLIDARWSDDAPIGRVRALAEKWETATELGTGSPSIVARAFAEELRKALGGNDVQ